MEWRRRPHLHSKLSWLLAVAQRLASSRWLQSSSCHHHRTLIRHQQQHRTKFTTETSTTTITSTTENEITDRNIQQQNNHNHYNRAVVVSSSVDDKSFRRNREKIAQQLLMEYDQIAFGGLLLLQPQQQQPPLLLSQQQQDSSSINSGSPVILESPSQPPNVTIRWSNRLRTTAGRAHLILHNNLPRKVKKRIQTLSRPEQIRQMELQQQQQQQQEQQQQRSLASNCMHMQQSRNEVDHIKTNVVQLPQPITVSEQLPSSVRRTAIVELSTKVVDDVSRLQTTLLHELCHVAAWIVDGNIKPPHGPCFQKWAKIAMTALPFIQVTTKHTFQIHYKYAWECYNPSCAVTFIRRHNRRSIDVKRHVCGTCHGPLRGASTQQLQNTPSLEQMINSIDNSTNDAMTASTSVTLQKPCPPIRRPLSEYQRFVQKYTKIITKQLVLQRKQRQKLKQNKSTTAKSTKKKSRANNKTGSENKRCTTTATTISPQRVMKECAKLWQQQKK